MSRVLNLDSALSVVDFSSLCCGDSVLESTDQHAALRSIRASRLHHLRLYLALNTVCATLLEQTQTHCLLVPLYETTPSVGPPSSLSTFNGAHTRPDAHTRNILIDRFTVTASVPPLHKSQH